MWFCLILHLWKDLSNLPSWTGNTSKGLYTQLIDSWTTSIWTVIFFNTQLTIYVCVFPIQIFIPWQIQDHIFDLILEFMNAKGQLYALFYILQNNLNTPRIWYPWDPANNASQIRMNKKILGKYKVICRYLTASIWDPRFPPSVNSISILFTSYLESRGWTACIVLNRIYDIFGHYVGYC